MKNLKTKLSYTLYILLVAFLMVGCNESNRTKDKDLPSFREAMSKYKVVEVEGCEYILFYGSNSELRYDGVTHKGNCKNH
ncbi:MAG: hypothetical protein ACJASR_000571 [Psychroserpens sp.]|jgi:hypothetical protein